MHVVAQRQFDPGTTGWTVDELSDPEILAQWSRGRYELVDGVLTKMAPQGFQGIDPLARLRRFLDSHVDVTRQGGEFYHEVDLMLRKGRLARPDLLLLTAEQRRQQQEITKQKGIARDQYRPVFVPPLLIVESVSPDHEDHDRVTKREWYAQAKIPHYWLLTAHERSLVILTLRGDKYVEETSGRDEQIMHTSAFGGLAIPLREVWGEQ